jgi:hypothetical protein
MYAALGWFAVFTLIISAATKLGSIALAFIG